MQDSVLGGTVVEATRCIKAWGEGFRRRCGDVENHHWHPGELNAYRLHGRCPIDSNRWYRHRESPVAPGCGACFDPLPLRLRPLDERGQRATVGFEPSEKLRVVRLDDRVERDLFGAVPLIVGRGRGAKRWPRVPHIYFRYSSSISSSVKTRSVSVSSGPTVMVCSRSSKRPASRRSNQASASIFLSLVPSGSEPNWTS